MRRPVAVVLLLTALAVPATAAAQDPAPEPTPTPTPTPVATPTATPTGPVTGVLTIVPEKVSGDSRAVLAGARWRVRGTLVPFVSGQRVAVRFYRGGTRKVGVKNVHVLPSRTGKSGFFLVSFRAKQPGHITVRASHRATPQLATAIAKGVGVDILPLRAKAGQHGLAVRLLQRRLARLGYVVGQRGFFDARTSRAVIAFRKNLGMARNDIADREVFRRLARGEGRFVVRYPQHGRHVEADISKQVMALIGEGGKVERIYHISSGAPGTPTILGTFRVYLRQYGTNAKGMVDPSYFIRGYAIHGYVSVPVYNASHGCLRVPIPDARSIHDWLQYGTIVDTYY